MKITIVLGAFLPVPPTMGGAVEKIWFLLAQEFARRGHDVVLVSRFVSGLAREEVRSGVKHLRIRGFDSPRSLLWLKFLDLLYSLNTLRILPKADVIVTNTFWLPILLRHSTRGRVYVHAARYPKGQMRLYGKAARLQAPSQAVAQAIIEQAPMLAEKVTVVPNPVPSLSLEMEPPSLFERKRIILYVGRLHPEKGVHLLVDAFALGARTVFADWRLMIVGPAAEKFGGGGANYLRGLKQRANGDVIFRGPIFDQVALAETFRAAKLFVYPSLAERGESFGVAPLEAMAQGAAVLVSNLACFHDFIRDGETGFIFDHRSKSATEVLQSRMNEVVRDEETLARVAVAGHQKAGEYSIDRVATQFLYDFDTVIQNPHAKRTGR